MTPGTPLPWKMALRVVPSNGQDVHFRRNFWEVGHEGKHGGVAFVFGNDEANAAYLVHAANAYPALVDFLRLTVGNLRDLNEDSVARGLGENGAGIYVHWLKVGEDLLTRLEKGATP